MANLNPCQVLVSVRSDNVSGSTLLRRLAEVPIALNGKFKAFQVTRKEELKERPVFDAARFHNQQVTHSAYGHVLLSAARLPSTQSLLLDNSKSFPDGTACVADVQDDLPHPGRGGNSWTSPPGCLMFSVLTRLHMEGTRVPFIQYVVSLAIVEAIESLTAPLLRQPAGSGLAANIKWPNDIYCEGSKIGGILCNSVWRDNQFQVIIGVGLNVSNEDPTTCINAEVRKRAHQLHMSDASSLAVDVEALLADILLRTENLMAVLKNEGFRSIEPAYTSAWLHSHQQVTVQGEGMKCDSVVIKGLTTDGYLLAEDELGNSYALSPDGNRLDFFKGLISRKLPAVVSDSKLYVHRTL